MRYAFTENTPLYRAGIFLLMMILGLLAYGLYTWAWESPAELAAYDMMLRMRPTPMPRNDIAILAIDKKTTDSMGRLPWSRDDHARIIRALQRGGARYIVYDMLFAQPDTDHPGGDEALWRAMISAGNVFMPMAYDPLRKKEWDPGDIRALIGLERFAVTDRIAYAENTPFFRYYYFITPWADFVNASAGIGGIVSTTRGPGVVRDAQISYLTRVRYPIPNQALPGTMRMPKFNDRTVVLPGLPLVITRAIVEVDKDLIETSFGNRVSFLADLNPHIDIPVNNEGQMMINYAGPAGSYRYISATDLLNNRVDEGTFADKIVFVGVTDLSSPLAAYVNTPYSSTPRVEITANALGTILDRSYITRNWRDALAVLLSLAFILGLVYPIINRFDLGGLAFGISLLYIVIAVIVLTIFRHALPVIPALLLILLGAALTGLIKPSPVYDTVTP
ncbi:MAG: CHASE2 domain-containing protein [Armatimonadota bacterium]